MFSETLPINVVLQLIQWDRRSASMVIVTW